MEALSGVRSRPRPRRIQACVERGDVGRLCGLVANLLCEKQAPNHPKVGERGLSTVRVVLKVSRLLESNQTKVRSRLRRLGCPLLVCKQPCAAGTRRGPNGALCNI